MTKLYLKYLSFHVCKNRNRPSCQPSTQLFFFILSVASFPFVVKNKICIVFLCFFLVEPTSDICLAFFLSITYSFILLPFSVCLCLSLDLVFCVSVEHNRNKTTTSTLENKFKNRSAFFSFLVHPFFFFVVVVVWLPDYCFTWAHLLQCPYALFFFLLFLVAGFCSKYALLLCCLLCLIRANILLCIPVSQSNTTWFLET